MNEPKRTKVQGETGIYRRGAVWEVSYPDRDRPGRTLFRRVPGRGGLRRSRAFRAELLAGASAPRARGDRGPQMHEVVESFLLAKGITCTEKTVADYRRHAKAHILPTLGNRPVETITADDLLKWIAAQHKTNAAAWTIRHRWNVLCGALSHAKRRGHITTHPADVLERGERPTQGARKMRILSTSEIDGMLGAAPAGWERLWCAMSVFTGLRLGELLALTWDDIDTRNHVVSVTKSINEAGEITRPKTEKSVRDVVLMASLEKMLREHRIASHYSLGSHPVFATRVGTVRDRKRARKAFKDAAAAAGIPPGLRQHDARHTFASILITHPELGEDVVFVSEQLGHKDVSTTLDIYSKLFDQRDHHERTRASLEAAFGALLR